MTIKDHPHRRARLHARQAAIQLRIVGERRADTDQDGVALRAEHVHANAHLVTGDLERPAPGGTDLLVGGQCKLERDMRSAFGDASNVAGVITTRLVGANADLKFDAGRADARMPLA